MPEEEQRDDRCAGREDQAGNAPGAKRSRSWATQPSNHALPDFRTYVYQGKEIDRQVHLGFDLASLMQAPVHAANRGVVLFANYLGIYGNCVVIDHGLGVQSLYGHLSTTDVKEGDMVEKGQPIGRTGDDGTRRRRSPAFHDARERRSREPGRVVGSALDGGPSVPQDSRSRRPGADAQVSFAGVIAGG